MFSKLVTTAARRQLRNVATKHKKSILNVRNNNHNKIIIANFGVEVEDDTFGNRGWTKGEFHSVENTLKEKLSEEDHANVTRVLYGLNQGKTVEELKRQEEEI